MLVALTSRNLTTGDTLTPPNYITSPSGDFTFGFRALDSNASSSFLLAIWLRFDGTVVWFATDGGSGSAVIATGQSVLRLTAAGQLSLAIPGNNNALWNPYTDPNQNCGSFLVLQDNGNLQFIGADGSTVVWESFGHPTDTLLPGQFMRPGTNLRSRVTDTDFSLGRFSLNVQGDGNIVLYMMDLPGDSRPVNAYWNTGTCCVENGNTTLFFDVEPVGHLYYILTDGSKHNLTAQLLHSTTRFYQHATLDPDGIFRVYILPKNTNGTGTWSVVNMFPTDGCETVVNGLHGFCGPNSYCINRTNKRLDCECPSGYIFFDTQFRYKGCIPSFVPDVCDGKSHSSEFKLVELSGMEWVNSIYYKLHQSITEEQCRDLCLNNCLCAAALFDGNNCKETSMLTTGWQKNGTATRTLIKVRTKGPPLRILPYALIACLAMLLLATTCILLVHCYITKKARKNYLSTRVFTRKELYRATNGFSKLLGQGGFGKVYHGIVKSLQPPDVAVKELKSGDDEYKEIEFENEVQSIGRINHKNLVRMVGYCKEGVHRMLVFEFMSGGSLGEFLFKSERPSWSWRVEAAIAIARGLEYLHYGCTSQIIHCDIKPDNILLDGNYAPKITDFGIARLLGNNKVKQTITHVRGTLGYLAPEWFNNERKVDSKVDVFSFGIVLLEMICCKKHPDQDGPRRDDDHSDLGMAVTLRAWVADLIREGNIERIVQGDNDALQDLQRVERFARVAIWCVQVDPSSRPTMRNVVWMLEGAVDVDPLPDPPRTLDFSATILSASSGTGSGTHDYSSSMTE
ncbi:G-type lectin S-receptor-like serine/threonine-protein kinase LECRK2 [Phragmites australis]|uniref:G-type lectin S-receptor-like serine/threonine-protein kinase LECRK2 n=1 Tax=Phragmites australis TaxID=29695 RepID=UPI002D7660C3|nr:G-type lectin S-receptor-like serine/threonine-protein kinase LECRK2 [Phragmites australis]